MRNIIVITILLIVATTLLSQTEELDAHDEHDNNDTHNAIGIANGLVYNFNEKNFTDGFHIHLVKGISHHWGIGLGYEIIFSEHKHQTITAFVKYKPHKRIALNIGPGISFPTQEHNEYVLSSHIEIVSVFELKEFHYGPMLGFGIGAEQHISLGLHIAYEL